MGKFEAKETKKKKFPVGIVIAAVLILVLALLPRFLNRAEEAPETQPAAAATETTAAPTQRQTEAPAPDTEPEKGIQFPVSLENGALELTLLFQYSGINPDCGFQEGSNIAAIELSNTSASYLAQADLALTLADGTVLNFAVTEVPAGRTVMAFCTDNLSVSASPVVTDIACTAKFADPDVSAGGKLTTSVEGVTVTVTNTSGEDLNNIVVYCRNLFDQDFFGGVTYQYTINELPAGESTTVEAWDCILGIAEVVRVAVDES